MIQNQKTRLLVAQLNGQGLVSGREYEVSDIDIKDDGFFVESSCIIATVEGTREIKNAHLAFDLGIK